ncbi:hypothetical protein DF3PA_450003 [Candidatus Defluviicoccus seviourii]|uniref:Uncharacterized protein n=1 Tax=Candidatus Defluviicoccus seviourii TaxID=2565273 RepID=A0A564WGS3_9PROT|nr:hypothetical protein DF3PA_450003 [Candidatus Defluviicoccus seviourii]
MDDAPSMPRVTFGKSRVREIRTPGSVRAKAEWLSYSTVTAARAWVCSLLAANAGIVYKHETSVGPRTSLVAA